jgi:hypothetical protein
MRSSHQIAGRDVNKQARIATIRRAVGRTPKSELSGGAIRPSTKPKLKVL